MTTFDVFDTDPVSTAGVTFSNGNLSAQGSASFSTGSNGIAQAATGHKTPSGQYYVEFTYNAAASTSDGVGIVSSWGIGSGALGGAVGGASGFAGWALRASGAVEYQGSSQTAVNNVAYTAGAVIGVAVDLVNKSMWFCINGGAWIGTATGANPATNSNGFNISSSLGPNNRVFPAAAMTGAAAKWTANFGATAFTATVPSGFTAGWPANIAAGRFGTFATTGTGTSSFNYLPAGSKTVSPYVPGTSGVLEYLTFSTGGTISIPAKAVVYDNTGVGGLPGNLLAESVHWRNEADGGIGYGEVTFAFGNVNLTAGTTYWFGLTTSQGSAGTKILAPVMTNGSATATDTFTPAAATFGASPTITNNRIPMIGQIAATTTVINGISSASMVNSQ
jgi:hypothetical protein